MPTTPLPLQVTAATFDNAVLAASFTTPVLLDFYTNYCGPCKIIAPILEKLAAAYHGAFTLAKVDVDQERELALRFQIRSVPTICLIKNGKVVDGFPGAIPEGELNVFLRTHGITPLPAPEQTTPPTATDAAAAIALLRQKIAASRDADADTLRLDLALACVQSKQLDEARTVIAALPAKWQSDPRAQRVEAFLRIDAHHRALTTGAKHPADAMEAALQEGVRALCEGNHGSALDHFIQILQHDRHYDNGRVRSLLLDAFAVIDDAALVEQYRRKMSAIIF